MKIGDRILVTCNDKRIYEGILLESEHKDSIVLKLDSGYNVGILTESIKTKKILLKEKQHEQIKREHKENPKLPIISILHTGGTIASKVDYRTGGVVARFSPEELVAMFPELNDICRVRSKLMANMWSEDMRFSHYKIMAEYIKKEIEEGAQGIIITHGTDTLAYSSAALSFILEELPVPVIFVGAQRSSDRSSSDAAINLISAAYIIANTDYSEVGVCMHKDSSDKEIALIRGTKARKIHTSRRDAFKPINDSYIATMNVDTKEIKFLQDYQKKGGRLVIKEAMEEKVGILKIHTNFDPGLIKYYTDQKYKGLVIEGTGLGHMPINVTNPESKENEKIKKALQELCKKCTILMTSQCIVGRVNMNVYSTGRDLQEIGIIPCQDMFAETAYVKLAWLLANNKKETRQLITKNLKGEITDRSLYEESFI